MGFFKEFKDFALKGNVVDLAVGIVIGAAFSAIVKSLVEDIITPLILTPLLEKAGLEDIKQLTWGAGVKYGNFLSNVISFIIVAFALFVIVKLINSMRKKEEAKPAAPPAPTNEEKLLMEIRDALKSRP
ncbi:mechanosensitive ion channel protein MscL [Flavobacterium akiainvivens]|uniref:Large-conductance mechanosensitive channel n=1 Tax=Flavobacterium akiainvivens TaxID=1202724 RepID=A0A0M8MJE3_9FLAO|nr:large conductance mechanosensitive channel protein MscL [Flavobacterium akiainvivens]KOS06778.1 mechanosensitive ion channel protein MscL [Flavobacterium akiainvivens]SFQ77142.1 large conductance mechanosensitive channel [Flavobacterium akiainvivens]